MIGEGTFARQASLFLEPNGPGVPSVPDTETIQRECWTGCTSLATAEQKIKSRVK